MNILILAEDTAIRFALEERLKERGRRFLMLNIDEVLERGGLRGVLEAESFDVVVNVASMALIEKWQDSDVLSGIKQMAEMCKEFGIVLLQRSNSQVFDGLDTFSAHREVEEPQPASRMGALNFQMEQIIKNILPRYLILRVPQIFSAHGENIFTGLLQELEQSSQLECSNIGRASPVAASDFARVISALLDQLSCGVDHWDEPIWGTYHYASTDPVPYFKYASFILERLQDFGFHQDRELLAVDDQMLRWRAPVLNCVKMRSTFGIKQYSWRMAINNEIRAYYNLLDEVTSLQ